MTTLRIDKEGRITNVDPKPAMTQSAPQRIKSPEAVELFGKVLLISVLVLLGITFLAICPPISPVAGLLFLWIMSERK